ncbi:hypothetical protein IF128_08510 [Empedobacter stercoris]|uniref:hypothetical protein n=1 Tax=Empedobacter stercoris TaxID=1628248 RepID=UPI0016626C01|nr:hypothetical protein [Empedobacter stercoris]MCA4809781.1 hypothetical protein [Empedobacter stercoris]QNT13908.1 hypothetical protein HNV03_04140 [Empedobacter stercoris]
MKKTIVVAMSVMLFWSCNTTSEKNAMQSEVQDETAHQHNENSDIIELNNGEKWKVNEEMKPFVSKGEELVNTYIQKNGTDYKLLAEEIKSENSKLIKSCTMQGKSHDELHKWLLPHLEIVKTLEAETDSAKATHAVTNLQQSYQDYHKNFK